MMRFLALAAAIAACLLLPASALADARDSRTNFWRLNETTGITAADSAGNGHGTYVGSPERGVTGATGDGDTAVRLNNGDENDWITTTATPFDNGTVRSFEGWAKRDSSTTYDMLFSGTGTSAPAFWLQTGTNTAQFRPNSLIGSNPSWDNLPAPGTGWFHWVLVFDEPGNKAELFIDGVSRGVRTTATNYSSPGNFTIGYTTQDNEFSGSVDDIAVYSRGLTPTEVGQLHAPDLASVRTAFWRLNETNLETTAVDSAGANDGTYHGGPVHVSGATGDNDTAVTLDGTNDRITTSYNPFDNGTVRSFEGWAKRDSNTTYDMLFSGTGTSAPAFWLQTGTNTAQFRPNSLIGSNPSWDNLPAPGTGWFHWVLVFDEPGDRAELFINGVSRGVRTTTTNYSSPGNFTIGHTSTENWFGGSVDDVAIYSRGLTSTEVGQRYQPSLSAARTAFWRLNETTGATAADSAGDNDGEYVGSPERGETGATGDGDTAVRLNNGDENDWITTDYNPFQPGTVRSFEGWAKRDSSTTYDMLFSGTGTSAPAFWLQQGTNTAQFRPNSLIGSNPSWDNLPAPGTGWFHWALVFDEPGNTAELFIDGESRGVRATTTDYSSSPGDFTIGYTTQDNEFSGSVDDIAVYSRGLSASEVRERAAVICDEVAQPPGTPGATITTPGQLNAALSSGETGCFRAGTYEQSSVAGENTLNLETAGVTLRSYPGERVTWRGRMVLRADDITLRGLILDGSYGPPCGSDSACLAANNAKPEAERCYDVNKCTFSTPVLRGEGLKLLENDIANRRPGDSERAGICVNESNSGDDVSYEIARNRIHDCGQLSSVTGLPRNHDHGIYVGAGDVGNGGDIHDNVIFDNADRGIQLYPEAADVTITNNTVDGNGQGLSIGNTSFDNTADKNVITNSTVRWNLESPSLTGPGNEVNNTCLLASNANTYYNQDNGIDVDWEVRERLSVGTVVTAPASVYVKREVKDFRLSSGTTCRNNGWGAPDSVASP